MRKHKFSSLVKPKEQEHHPKLIDDTQVLHKIKWDTDAEAVLRECLKTSKMGHGCRMTTARVSENQQNKLLKMLVFARFG